MTCQRLNGTRLAAEIQQRLHTEVQAFQRETGKVPGLAMVLAGDDPASAVYVRNKIRACSAVGFWSVNRHLPETVDQATLLKTIDDLNKDPAIHGILVQLPLPDHLDTTEIIERILPEKDVDGFHPYNIGRLVARKPALRPATPKGVMHLLEQTGVPLRGLNATIVGASNHVGRPMGLELLLVGCTVTTVHKFTRDIDYYIRHADILISAVGKPGLIKGEQIKPAAIVIDIGLTRCPDGTLKGDIDYPSVRRRAGWLTPVPGGVGPMTIAALLENTMQAAREHVSALKG